MAVSSKESFINDIGDFILSSEATVEHIVSKLGWSTDHMFMKDDCYATCPLDSAHLVPYKSLDKHVEICSCVKDGYSKEEMESLPPDPKFCYERSNSIVTIPFDENIQDSIVRSVGWQTEDKVSQMGCKVRKVPRTMDRAASEFSREERLAIYDYVVARSRAVMKDSGIRIEEMNLNFNRRDETEKPKSFLEVLAEQRDYKRRRQSYRAKNVHITKKSYTEVMREVIQKQMEYLSPEMKEESVESRDESADSSREFGFCSYGKRNDDRHARLSTTHSFGRERWREQREADRMRGQDRERTRTHTRDEPHEELRSRKRHRSRTPTTESISPPPPPTFRSDRRDESAKQKKKHKRHHHHHHHHRHHKRTSSS